MRRTIAIAAVVLALLLVVAAARVVASIVGVRALPTWNVGGADAHGDPLPEGAVARLGTVRFRTTTSTNLLWLADGRIASGGFDEEIVIWDAHSGERAQVLAGHRGRLVLPAEHWDWRNVQHAVLDGAPPTVSDYLRWGHLAQHGDRLISAGATIREWDLRTGVGRLVAWPRGGNVAWFVLRDDGRVLEFRRNGSLRRFVLATGEELERVPIEGGHAPLQLATSPDGAWWTNHTIEGGLVLVRTSDGSSRMIAAPPEDVYPRAVCFSPDGARLWCIWTRKGTPEEVEDRRSRLVAYDVRSGAETARIPLDDSGRWWICTISPDGRRLVTATLDGHVELRDASSHEVVRFIDVAPAAIHGVTFSPNSRRLALHLGGRAISFVDLDTGERRSVANAHEGAVLAAVFVDDETVITAGNDGVLRAWEARTGRASWERRSSTMAFPAPAARGGELAVATHDGVRMLRTSDGERVSAERSPPSGWRTVSVAADGTLLLRSERAYALLPPGDGLPRDIVERGVPSDAMQGTRTELVGWDTAGGRALVQDQTRTRLGENSYRSSTDTLRLIDAERGSIVWSAAAAGGGDVAAFTDGLTAVGTGSGKIRVFDERGNLVWGLDTRAEDRSSDGPFGIVAVAFSPDGTRLASGGADHVVRVWSMTDGALEKTLRGHGGRVTAVAWSPDGTLLVSGSDDTSALVWDVAD